MLNKVILYSFYILLFLTPIYFNANNSELFEFNKMMIVYIMTTIITTTWVIKMIQERKFIFQRTFLDIPILLFLLSQIISTFISIDIHTSLWGYYSRSNGGLVSTICYLLLFYAFLSNFGTKEYVIKCLKISLFSGLVVALWAIPEHFGVDPSCILLNRGATDACWQQDVQARVFSTLGQPNWLAAYLEMLIFPAIYFATTAKDKLERTIYYFLSAIFYLAFTFTYSRGAFIGLLAGLVVFIGGTFFHNIHSKGTVGPRIILTLLTFFLIINLFFASALTSFQLIHKDAAPARPGIATASGGGSELDSGGTESGAIRLIVWKGAIDIFKHYPLFGSGVETFAYSYYNFRPLAHNGTSEWDFLYNKAHNEYLNYLATSGIFGLATHLLIIGTFIAWSTVKVLKPEKKTKEAPTLMLLTILGAYIAYLIQNAVGFSVVIIALFFFLFPAFSLAMEDTISEEFWIFKSLSLPDGVTKFFENVSSKFITKSKNSIKIFSIIVGLLGLYIVITFYRNWLADTHYNTGTSLITTDPATSYNELLLAVSENPGEPNYTSELGYSAAIAAVASHTQAATLSAQLKDTSIYNTALALSKSPRNVTLWTNAILSYYELSSIDPSYTQKTLDALDMTISLAPTDPKFLYDKAQILISDNKPDQALPILLGAMKLKPDYHDAGITLAGLYNELGQKDRAISEYQTILQLFPADPEATTKLKTLEAK